MVSLHLQHLMLLLRLPRPHQFYLIILVAALLQRWVAFEKRLAVLELFLFEYHSQKSQTQTILQTLPSSV